MAAIGKSDALNDPEGRGTSESPDTSIGLKYCLILCTEYQKEDAGKPLDVDRISLCYQYPSYSPNV